MEEYKNKLIKIIEEIKIEDSYKEPIINFINSYDGNDSEKFHNFNNHIIDLLCLIRKLKVKAEAYDALENLNDEYESSMENIKEEYEELKQGYLSPGPAVPTGLINSDNPDQQS